MKVAYNLYFTKISVQNNWRRLDQLHMGYARGVIKIVGIG